MKNTQIHETLRLLKKLSLGIESSFNTMMASKGITAAQGDVLAYLLDNRKKGIYATEIHQNLGISRAAVSALLKKLKNKGLLVFRSDPADERQKQILLTEEAGRYQEIMDQCMEHTTMNLYQGFTVEETEVLRNLLQKMCSNLSRMNNELSAHNKPPY